MAATKAIPSIDQILNTIPQKDAEHILMWFWKEHIKQGKDKQYEDDDLKMRFGDLIALCESNVSTTHRVALDQSGLRFEHFINLVLNGPSGDEFHPQDLPVQIGNPSEIKPVDVPPEKDNPSDQEKQAREQALEKNRAYDERKANNDFFADLMRDELRKQLQVALEDWRKNEKAKIEYLQEQMEQENGLGIKQRREISKQKKALARGVNYVKDFEKHIAKVRDETKKSIDPHRAEERYLFKTEATLYNLLLHPDDPKAQAQCSKLNKELSGSLNVKYIVIGIVLLAVAAALIGVTCGIAAGVILPGLVLGSMLGVGILSGGFGIGLTLGVTAVKGSKLVEKFPKIKIKKGGIYNGAPGINRNTSFFATRTAKAIQRDASDSVSSAHDAVTYERNARKFGDSKNPDEKDDFGGTATSTTSSTPLTSGSSN